MFESPLSDQPTLRVVQRRERIHAILEIARKVFTDEGYANFSSRKVAAAAGVSLSLIQHYFGSHKNLLLETVDSIVGLYPERYRELLNDTQTPADQRLNFLMDDTLDGASDPEICRFIFQSLALGSHDSAAGQLFKARYAMYIEAVSGLVQQVRPDLSIEVARILAVTITSQMDGLMFLYFRGNAPIPALAEVRNTVKESIFCLVRNWPSTSEGHDASVQIGSTVSGRSRSG